MSFPFPDDATALARLDWCRSGSAEDFDGLSCVLRARMCSQHVQATGNKAWAASAAPVFSELLSAARVKEWTPCPEGDVAGVCGMLMTSRYGPPLWQGAGFARERRLYDELHAGLQSAPEAPAMLKLPACP
jgi:hypothetical protein